MSLCEQRRVGIDEAIPRGYTSGNSSRCYLQVQVCVSVFVCVFLWRLDGWIRA